MTSDANRLSVLDKEVLERRKKGDDYYKIASDLGISPEDVPEISKRALDTLVNVDPEENRKLQMYRLESLMNQLWAWVDAGLDEMGTKSSNIIRVLERIESLLGLAQKEDEAKMLRITQYQADIYLSIIGRLINSFKEVSPDTFKSDEEWQKFTVLTVSDAQKTIEKNNTELEMKAIHG